MGYARKLWRMVYGSVVFGIGTVMAMDSNIGYGPWDIFHAGIANYTGLTVGEASVLVGTTLIILDILLREPVGISTAGSMIIVALIIDGSKLLPWRPICETFVTGVIYMIAGMFVCALGVMLYIGAELGTGPRDGIMVAIRRHLKLPVGAARLALELAVMALGWLMGGPFGVGSLIYAFGLGSAIQIVFNVFRFEATKVQHDSFADSWRALRSYVAACKEKR